MVKSSSINYKLFGLVFTPKYEKNVKPDQICRGFKLRKHFL